MRKESYPKFHLRWKTVKGYFRNYTTDLGIFLKEAEKLKRKRGFISCNWTIIYAAPSKAKFAYDGGKRLDYFENRSVVYTDPKQCFNDVVFFTNPDELKSCRP